MRLGIIGGIGTAAGINVAHWLVQHRVIQGITSDGQYPSFTLHNLPSEFTDEKGLYRDEVKTVLADAIKTLATFCDKILVACYSAHKWYDELNKVADGKLINLVGYAFNEHLDGQYVGVICSETAQADRIFERVAAKRKIRIVYPDTSMRSIVNNAIRTAIVRGDVRSAHMMVRPVVLNLYQQTKQKVVLGCTDLSMPPSISASLAQLVVDPVELATRDFVWTLLGLPQPQYEAQPAPAATDTERKLASIPPEYRSRPGFRKIIESGPDKEPEPRAGAEAEGWDLSKSL